MNNCDIHNIVLSSVHEHVTVASIGIIYVNLLDFILYLDTASIILKLRYLMLTPCNIMFKITEVLLSSV